jgi:DNA modification methylase
MQRACAREGDASVNLADKLTVEQWPIDRLIEYARNPRKNDAVVDQMAGAIREFGFRIPIVAKSDGSVVDGHLRLKAARKLGLTEVPVALADELTDAQIKAFRLLVNRSANWSEWDTELLRLELGDLNVLGFDLTLTGFGEIELGSLLADKTEGLTDPDDAPAVPEHPVSQTGDLWLLGRHRLLCGDSTVATDVERVLGGVEPHLMVTDPPYGIEYDPAWRNRAAAAGLIGQKKSTRATGQVENDDRADWSEAWALFPGAVAYVWHAGTKVGIVQDSLDRCDFETRAQIVWVKNNFAIGRGHYHCKHEPCWYAVRKGSTGHWAGDRKQTTVWNIDKNLKSETGHGTQKPVECMQRPIENNSSPGQAVYEPFSGSGTTIIAAERSGRSCHAIELSPKYVDVAIKRWQDFTGARATLDGDGRCFDEIAAARAAKAATEEPAAADD